MKAARFIAIFSFLLVFNGASASVIRSQDDKDTKETIKPTEIVQVIPVKQKEERYRIGMYDVLEVTVYKHAELSQGSVKMDEYGRIRLPKIAAPIMAICKTENELANEITEIYKENYLVNPYVTVVVREQNSQPLSVIGAVKKPGSYYTNRRLTLLELLSIAGGPDVEFAGTKIEVARVGGISGCKNTDTNAETNEEGITFFSYNLADVLKGRTNPLIKPGDIVSLALAEQVYVTGNVLEPKPISLKQEITLTQAIAAAGGMLPATKKSEVIIRRRQSGTSKTQDLVFNLKDITSKKIDDPMLMANDIIFVPTDKVKDFTNSFIKAMTGGIGNIFLRFPTATP